jgi:hypothetical protein
MTSQNATATALLLRQRRMAAHVAVGGVGGVIVLLAAGFLAAVAFDREAGAWRVRD